MTTVRARTTWKRSRLLAGGAVVLIGALWTGPQMAAAAPNKPKPKDPTTTTTVAPTTTTTAAPAPAPAPAPTPTGNGGTSNAGGNGSGNSPSSNAAPASGGGAVTPSSGAGASSSESIAGSGGSSAPTASTSPSPSPSPKPSAAAPRPSSGQSRTRTGTATGNVVGPVLSDVAVPPAAGSDNTLNALQGPDRAAQATVRSINGGQSLPAQGGTALYAQLASSPAAMAVDDYPGNPYLVFVILVVFGIGIGLTGRQRHATI